MKIDFRSVGSFLLLEKIDTDKNETKQQCPMYTQIQKSILEDNKNFFSQISGERFEVIKKIVVFKYKNFEVVHTFY